jgi:peroxiredoxin Q/BCP
MAAKKRGKKKAQASKVKAKKKGARGAASAGARKKAGKKKKKAASKKVAVEAPVLKKASKKRSGKKRAARKSPAPAPERMTPPPEAEDGLSPAEEAEAEDDGDDEPAPDDEEDGEPPGIGDHAPAFALSDHEGKRFSSQALAGKPYVLYFYPKDDTPGCTREACDFRDARASFEATGVRVIGVSPDSAASHGKFGGKYQLNFPLLADVDKTLTKAYGAWVLKKNYGREYMGVERSTFLVGADGKLKQIWRGVRVNGHIAAVQAAAASL